jgi:hypothetical protein
VVAVSLPQNPKTPPFGYLNNKNEFKLSEGR